MRNLMLTQAAVKQALGKLVKAAGRRLRPHRRTLGRIAYNLCTLALLIVIAVAAERYRDTHEAAAAAAVQTRTPAAQTTAPIPTATPAPHHPAGAEQMGAFCAQPLWNEDMRAWVAHTGLDYRYPEGEPVRCLADGTISTIEYGGAEGTVVEVRAADMLWRYGSLADADGLLVGDAIAVGEKIGMPGISRPDEAQAGVHLHLEIIDGSRALNPAAILATAD